MIQLFKPLVLLTTCLLVSKSLTYSQTYHPFLNNSSWVVNEINWGGTTPFDILPGYDTIINGTTYKKYPQGTNFGPTSITEIVLREDINARQVFTRINNQDYVMFDFSLQIGDPFTYHSHGGGTVNYTVHSIDSIQVISGYRKRFTLFDGVLNYLHWIEGVGYPDHPIVSYLERFSDPDYQILCSFQGNTNIFNRGLLNTGTISDCNVPVTIAELETPEEISLAPNPATDIIALTFNQFLSDATVVIYNLFGQEVLSKTNVSGNMTTVDLSNLRSGVYICSVSQNNTMYYRQKIVVQTK